MLGNYSPNMDVWKKGLTDEEISVLEPIMQAVVREMDAEEPTVKRLLEADLPNEQRLKYVQFFFHYRTLDPYTDNWLQARKILVDVLKSPMTREQKLEFESLSRCLKDKEWKPWNWQAYKRHMRRA